MTAAAEADSLQVLDYGSPAVTAKKDLPWADVLRSFAAFAVVMIHVAGQGVAHTELMKDKTYPMSKMSWWVANFFDASARWSVPVFVMVSGALLLGSKKSETIGEFFKRRLMRVGIPLVFWSATYLLWRQYYINEGLTWKFIGNALLLGSPAFHLYFLFLIFGLYLFTPMFRLFVRNASHAELWFTTIAALVLTAILQDVRTMIHIWSQPTAFDYFVPYVGYFLAGYAIVNTKLPREWEQQVRVLAYVTVPVSLTIIVLGLGLQKTDALMNRAMQFYYEFPSPPVMAMSLAIFAIVVDLYRNPGPARRKLATICAWIAPASFGIYLLHPMLLWEVFKRSGMPVYPNTLIACPAWTTVLFIACLIITKNIQAVPGLRRIVG